jgi:hypothetical protein
MPGGGKGGKGGGGMSLDVDADINAVVDADINAVVNADITSNNRMDTNANAAVQIVGLDNIRMTADVTSDNKAAIAMDLKPLQVDLCLKVGLERLPSTNICRSSAQHVGVTLFGVEIVGLNYSSDGKTGVEDLGNRPFVVSDSVHSKPHECDYESVDGIRVHVVD